MHMLSLLGGSLAAPLAALSMTRSLWLPFTLAFISCLAQLGLASTIEGTQKTSPVLDNPLSCSASAEEDEAGSSEPFTSDVRGGRAALSNFLHAKGKLYNVLSTPQIATCLAIFSLKRAGFQSQPFIYQYASERFILRLQQTPWFGAARSGTSVIIVGIGLPTLTSFLRKAGLQQRGIDLGVLRGTALILTTAFFGIWAASNTTFYSLGKHFGTVKNNLANELEPSYLLAVERVLSQRS